MSPRTPRSAAAQWAQLSPGSHPLIEDVMTTYPVRGSIMCGAAAFSFPLAERFR